MSNSTSCHEFVNATAGESHFGIPLSRWRTADSWPGPANVVFNHTESRLYGVKSQTAEELVRPAHLAGLSSEIVSRIALDPSCFVLDSRFRTLIAPTPELTGPQPIPVSMESNCELLSAVLWSSSPMAAVHDAVVVPVDPFAYIQPPGLPKSPSATRFSSWPIRDSEPFPMTTLESAVPFALKSASEAGTPPCAVRARPSPPGPIATFDIV